MGKTDTRQRTTWGNRFRFLVRVAGITGILAVAVGASLLDTVVPVENWTLDNLRSSLEGVHGQFAQNATYVLAAGAAGAALAAVVELLGGLMLVTGRRTVASTTATIGTAAAICLLVIVNIYSFYHHQRFDLTREKLYTLPPELVGRFSKLRSEEPTTIVVLQMHSTFGSLSAKRDSYTAEAERVVTEKVKDLVDQFREFGPRFKVVVFDTEAFEYKPELKKLKQDAPELHAAIEAATENSIFFYAKKHVQQLSFNDFLKFDRTASEAVEEGRENLVLLPQGEETFARRILAVQERRPKVAVLVVHELLTTTNREEGEKNYSHAGLGDALTNNGFEVVDIVMKKNWASARSENDLKPSADTREETKLERLEGALALAQIKAATEKRTVMVLERLQAEIDKLKERPWSERLAAYRQIFRLQGSIAEEDEPELLKSVAKQTAQTKQSLEKVQKKVQAADADLQLALKDERTVEDRRIADAKEKLKAKLADVDLIIIPRFTVDDAAKASGPNVPSNLHGLHKDLVEVIRDFMVAGKPVMACLGPISEPQGPNLEGPDGFEKLLAERGIALGSETILFDVEEDAFAARIAGEQLGSGVSSNIPPLSFVDTPDSKKLKPNPIAEAVQLTVRSAVQQLNLKKKAPRPVSLQPGWQKELPFAAEFVFSSPDCWNEEKPFIQFDRIPGRARPVPTYVPEFEPTTVGDPKWGTPQAVRKGPFSIGVAIESKVPAAWVKEEYEPQEFAAALVSGSLFPVADPIMPAVMTVAANDLDRKTQRLVVFGSGNLFSGAKLDPAQEKLLLHSVNWLTNRPDRLPRGDLKPWSYPRVEMTEQESRLWQRGTAIVLPLLAIFLGCVAMMFRRLR